MIKFFRKIRQKLLTENKTEKYFKYAIGEIVLVVIGILIALNINNWNESRKRENLKQRLYVELYESIKSDTVNYNEDLNRLKSVKINTEILKEKIKFDAPYSSDLDSSLAKIGLIRSIEADYTILTRISDVGFEIMDDVDLKNEVIHYYEDSKNFVKYVTRSKDLLEKIYPKYFTKHIIGEIAVPEDFEVLKKINEFKIALDYCQQTSEELLKRTDHRKDLALNILEMLDNQITISNYYLRESPYIRLMKSDTIGNKVENNWVE